MISRVGRSNSKSEFEYESESEQRKCIGVSYSEFEFESEPGRVCAKIYLQKWYSFAQKIVDFRVYYGVLILGLVVNSEIDNLLCKRIPLL
jgi:hypothetical protein